MQRHFTDDQNKKYIYDTDAPEVVHVSPAEKEPVHKYGLTDDNKAAFTALLPPGSARTVSSLDEVIKNPALEAYCTPEFWQQRTLDDWISVLVNKQNHLLVHAPNDFLEKSAVKEWSDFKWYIGKFRGASCLAGIVAAVLCGVLSFLCGAGLSRAVFYALIAGIPAFVYIALSSKPFFLNKSQALMTGLAGGCAFCAFPVLLLLAPTFGSQLAVVCMFLAIPVLMLCCFKKVVNCRIRTTAGLILPGLSVLAVLLAGVAIFLSLKASAGNCRLIARNFHAAGITKVGNYYMDSYIDRHNQYGRKLAEFSQAVDNKKLSNALSAYAAVTEVWQENPLLPRLADKCTAMVAGLKLAATQDNIDELVRARKLFAAASEKTLSRLADIELSLRNGQLAAELKNVRKAESFSALFRRIGDWEKKAAHIEALDKNYASLKELKSEIAAKQKSFTAEVRKHILGFERIFDQNFPPEKHLALLQRELPVMNDIYRACSRAFSEHALLRYAWLLTLADRKSGLALLKQNNQGSPAFLLALVDGGTALEKFSETTESDLLRSLTLRKPLEAELFFRFLLDRYHFKPAQLSYLLAMSRKEQKKPFAATLESAILNNFPDRNGFYLAWVPAAEQKIPVLEQIVKGKMVNWQKAAANLGEKYFAAGDFKKSFDFYRLAGDAAASRSRQMNKAYYESNKEKIQQSVRSFMLEFDRVYTTEISARPPADFDCIRCLEFLGQDFQWRYAWASYQHSNTPALRNDARALLNKIKSPETTYLLAKIDQAGKELSTEAVQAGASAAFKKIRLEATRYKLQSPRFANNEKLEGIRYLFAQGELSAQEKLFAGKFLMRNKDVMNARKIFESLPDSGDKAYQLFLCDQASGNKVSAHNNFVSALKQGYPVPYEEYKRMAAVDNRDLMKKMIANRGSGFKKAALDFARFLVSKNDCQEAAFYFKEADPADFSTADKGNYGFSLWESGDKSPLCFEMCMMLPDERIGANLAWNIYQYLFQKKDMRSDIWLKAASNKGNPDAENARYLILRRDDSQENAAEKTRIWKNCISRSFKEAIIDVVEAAAMGEPCPVGKDVIVRCGELFYNNLSEAEKKEYSKLKDKLGLIKEL